MANVIAVENTSTTNITIIVVVHNGMVTVIVIPLEFILKTANDCLLVIESKNNAN
jgi:hypothetical protein